MLKTKRLTVPILALIAALLLPAAAADAKRTKVRVGVGDQNAAMFSHPDFQAAKIKRVRYFIRWDAIRHPDVLASADAYVAAARAANASVLMHISSDNLERKKAKLPKLKRYKKDVRRLIRRYRKMGVREWGARNEANHDSQATWKSPKRAAQEFKIVRRYCKGCTIIALDVLDQQGVERYIKRFYRKLGRYRRFARIIGIHNYSDVNRKRTRGTKSIIRTVRRYNKRSQFWLTETGGIVNFGGAWPYNERRSANRLKYLFKTTRRMRKRIKRVYVYNWYGAERGARFDAGLVNPDGSPRPGLRVFKRKVRKFLR